ncbi:MAG: nitroreductase family protein [Candidatus Omnitrophica bacterium]|nr:nitroreductase family protein [Candidatus Omnitrophota bacterium]
MANIKNRRSRRAFLDRSIPAEIIEEILEAGRYAPSALNKQPWKFIVIANKEVIRQLSDIIRGIMTRLASLLPLLRIIQPELRDPKIVGAIKKTVSSSTDAIFYNAPLLILVIAANNAGRYAVKDCTLASQNMMLYAHSLGISSCFIGRGDLLALSKHAKHIIGLPPGHKIHTAVVFGYVPIDENISVPERRKDNIVNWIR